MEEKIINKTVRMNEIRKEIAWISGEYTRMFPTDVEDVTMVADNERFHCLVLAQLLISLKQEIENNKYDCNLLDKCIMARLQSKLVRLEVKDIQNLNNQEARAHKTSFNLKMD